MPVSESELDAIVAELKVEVPQIPELENKRSFRTYRELRDFVTGEVTFWEQLPLKEVTQRWRHISSQLSQAEQGDSILARNYINRAVREAQDAHNQELVYSNTRRGQFLVLLGL